MINDEGRSLLTCAADLLDGSKASQQYDDQCGYLAEQIREYLARPKVQRSRDCLVCGQPVVQIDGLERSGDERNG